MKTQTCLFLATLFMLVSCSKKETGPTFNCDNAELRVINTGTDTILYSFSSYSWNNKLAPSDSASYFFGPLQSTCEDLYIWQVDVCTPHNTYKVEMNSCLQLLKIHAP